MSARPKLKVVEIPPTGSSVSRKTQWSVWPDSPKTADDLSFTSRDAQEGRVWWDVDIPNTQYHAVHATLGRAYAFELLDLINNPNGDFQPCQLGFISAAMMRWARNHDWRAETVAQGFYSVLGEYLATGTASR